MMNHRLRLSASALLLFAALACESDDDGTATSSLAPTSTVTTSTSAPSTLGMNPPTLPATSSNNPAPPTLTPGNANTVPMPAGTPNATLPPSSGTGSAPTPAGSTTSVPSTNPGEGGALNSGGMNDGGAPNFAGSNTGGSVNLAGSGNGGTANVGGLDETAGSAGALTGGSAGTDMPGVRIVGRTVEVATGTRFAWSGTSIAARFSGTQVSMQLNDGGNENSFEIVIDGGTPTKLTTSGGQSSYQLASGLPSGTHDVLIWRNTEANVGTSEFVGLSDFGQDGALLPPPPAPDRRIEVIGDSISCGAGIEGSGNCTTSNENENHYLSYGAVAARSLGADLITIAWSGIGMYRNYNQSGPSGQEMPDRYDFAIPGGELWDFSKYQPHAVVINLTSNDFSTQGDPGAPYVEAYVNFVKRVRSNYPAAFIFCVIEWSSSDDATNQIVSDLIADGVQNVAAFDIRPSANGSGCSGHPDIAGGQAMGEALADEIRSTLGW